MSICSDDTTPRMWDRRTLTSPVAIVLFTAAPTADARRIILFAGAADSQNFAIVPSDRFAEFLLQHAECTFICENAADFHWTIYFDAGRLGDDTAIRDALWRSSTEHRLFDVQLFEQLVQLASSGDETAPRPLAELVHDKCECNWEPPDQIAADALRFRDVLSFPADLLSRACGVARSLWRLHNVLLQAAEAAAQRSLGTSADSPFGPLGLGIQVQTRIALGGPQSRLIVDELRAAEAIAALELEIEQQTRSIRRISRLADCLEWRSDQLVLDSGLPRIKSKKRLRELLVQVWGDLSGLDGASFPYIANNRDLVSLSSDDLGLVGQCEPNLRAWCQLNTSAHQLHFIRKFQGQSIDVGCEVLPRLRPHPREAVLKKLISGGLLRLPDTGRCLILNFEGLELRALASWCDILFRNSALATAYRNQDDPVRELADRLTISSPRFFQNNAQRISAAELVLTAIGQRIGVEDFRRLVRLEFDEHLDPPTAANWRQTAFELFPELQSYQDDILDRLAINLGVHRTTIEQQLATCEDFATIGAQTQGKKPCGPAFEKLRGLIADRELRSQAWNAGANTELYMAMYGRSFRLPTGRIRAKSPFAQGNAEYLDLADDALKSAIFALAASGANIVAVANRTVLIEVADQVDPFSMVRRASEAAESILGIPVTMSAVAYRELQ